MPRSPCHPAPPPYAHLIPVVVAALIATAAALEIPLVVWSASDPDSPGAELGKRVVAVSRASGPGAFNTTAVLRLRQYGPTGAVVGESTSIPVYGPVVDASLGGKVAVWFPDRGTLGNGPARLSFTTDATDTAAAVSPETSFYVGGARRLEKTPVNTSAYPRAVCNDNSTYHYYVSLNASSSDWVIYLQGGGACFLGPDCPTREARYTSSTPTADYPDFRQDVRGLFSQSPLNPFRHANMLWLPYCSSDAWSGDSEPQAAAAGFVFRGRRNLEAVVDTFRSQLENASNIIFGGCSAGAIGAAINTDHLRSQFPSPRFLGFGDSGYLVGHPGYAGATTLVELIPSGMALWNGFGDHSCHAAASAGEAWRCYLPAFIAQQGEFSSDFAVHIDQFDSTNLEERGLPVELNNLAARAYNASEREYVHSVRAAIRANLTAEYPPRRFSSTCTKHCCANNENCFFNMRVNGVSLAETVGAWLTGGDFVSQIEDCGNPYCNPTCNETVIEYMYDGSLDAPTPSPTSVPTSTPTAAPVFTPTPTNIPTSHPVFTPTPTNVPTPTNIPTSAPVFTPTPTNIPTSHPVFTPTPTNMPTSHPVFTPTPTNVPTSPPVLTSTPTNIPTSAPVFTPTPTGIPSLAPTTLAPTPPPTTLAPTPTPTTLAPTTSPTTLAPTGLPTPTPTTNPTHVPTAPPTNNPTAAPTPAPTPAPAPVRVSYVFALDFSSWTLETTHGNDSAEYKARLDLFASVRNNQSGLTLDDIESEGAVPGSTVWTARIRDIDDATRSTVTSTVVGGVPFTNLGQGVVSGAVLASSGSGSGSSDNTGWGVIVGAVIGGVVAVAVLGVVLYTVFRGKHRRGSQLA